MRSSTRAARGIESTRKGRRTHGTSGIASRASGPASGPPDPLLDPAELLEPTALLEPTELLEVVAPPPLPDALVEAVELVSVPPQPPAAAASKLPVAPSATRMRVVIRRVLISNLRLDMK